MFTGSVYISCVFYFTQSSRNPSSGKAMARKTGRSAIERKYFLFC